MKRKKNQDVNDNMYLYRYLQSISNMYLQVYLCDTSTYVCTDGIYRSMCKSKCLLIWHRLVRWNQYDSVSINPPESFMMRSYISKCSSWWQCLRIHGPTRSKDIGVKTAPLPLQRCETGEDKRWHRNLRQAPLHIARQKAVGIRFQPVFSPKFWLLSLWEGTCRKRFSPISPTCGRSKIAPLPL